MNLSIVFSGFWLKLGVIHLSFIVSSWKLVHNNIDGTNERRERRYSDKKYPSNLEGALDVVLC